MVAVQQNLRIPGPTPVPPEVMAAMSKSMINHRGPEFAELIAECTSKLKLVYETQNDLYILTASGTGALEASIVNTLSVGDKVLAPIVGAFGDRYADCAERFGTEVWRLQFEWGTAVDPEAVRAALQQEPDIKAVLLVHNETSTGVVNDLESIARVVKGEFGKLLLVDAVSSLGCVRLPVDEWNLDTCVTGSQKGFMMPPGLSFISMSDEARQAQMTADIRRFYFDLEEAQQYLQMGQTPWTPAISLYYGLRVVLDMLLGQPRDEIHARYENLARITREGVKALGLELLVQDESYASPTVTAVKIPSYVDGSELVRLIRRENVELAGGQGKLSGRILRIGHMGCCIQEDINDMLRVLGYALARLD